MEWTFANLIIQIVSGIFGGHALAVLIRDNGFRGLGHTLIGAGGGAFGGLFLQTLAITMVTATGSQNVNRIQDEIMLNVLCGMGAGAALLLGITIWRHHLHG